MYQLRQIIVLMRQGESCRAIARMGHAGRNKVKQIHKIATRQGWLDLEQALPDDEALFELFRLPSEKPCPRLSVQPHLTQIEEWTQQGIQATTIHAALQRQHGFQGGYDVIRRQVKKIKAKSPKTTMILDFKPGECAQVDFGKGPTLVDDKTGEEISTWIFVMVLAFSRHQYSEMVLHQNVETWLGCHRRAFEWFGGVPTKVIIDNPKCAITKACYHDPVVQRAYFEYAQGYGFQISPCPPRDPQKKGKVEAGVKYVKNNFVPLRIFRNLVHGNEQLKQWIIEVAGQRIHGSTREKPLVSFEIERTFLKPLPENPPERAVYIKVRLHGDCHVQYLKCRYSAPYQWVKQDLWLRASETTVRLYHEHQLIATHPRLYSPGSRHTVEAHLPPNALAYCMQDASWCLKQAALVGVHCEALIKTLLNDSVVDYLRAAQGILRLQKKYSGPRLETACQRAICFQSFSYKTVKSILETGADYQALPEEQAFEILAETYTGKARFHRDTSTLLQ
jgi:transposase